MDSKTFYITYMSDFSLICPHCKMQITFGVGDNQDLTRGDELIGFVFTCPNCHTPISYQTDNESAVELDDTSFENFNKSMERFIDKHGKSEFFRENKAKHTKKNSIDENIFDNMLKDIKDSSSYDDFLKRIEL